MMVGDSELRKMRWPGAWHPRFCRHVRTTSGQALMPASRWTIAHGMAAFSFKDGIELRVPRISCSPAPEAATAKREQAYPIIYLYRRSFPASARQVPGRRGAGDGWVDRHATAGLRQRVAAGEPALDATACGAASQLAGTVSLPIRHRYPGAVQAGNRSGHQPRAQRVAGTGPRSTANIRMLESDDGAVGTSGGGYGDPIRRDLDLVVKDVAAGTISAEVAQRIYGVIVNDQALDAATRERRDEIDPAASGCAARRSRSARCRRSPVPMARWSSICTTLPESWTLVAIDLTAGIAQGLRAISCKVRATTSWGGTD